jgi:hypothetical protein
LLIMLPHTDLKIIQKCVLIDWNEGFVLDVFDLWLKFVECLCGHWKFPLKFCKREFLLMYLVQHLFVVEMRWPVVKLKMSQVTDIVEKGN